MFFESFFSTLTIVVVKMEYNVFIDSYRDYGLKILQHKMSSFERAGRLEIIWIDLLNRFN